MTIFGVNRLITMTVNEYMEALSAQVHAMITAPATIKPMASNVEIPICLVRSYTI